MSGIDSLLQRFPEHEPSIRYLIVHDPEFRAVCEDCEAIRQALEHWQKAAHPVPGRIEECQRLLAELEAEALVFLNACPGTGRS